MVSWTTVIAGYAQCGHGEEALKLFRQMQVEGMEPDHFIFATVLGVAAGLTTLEHGKQIHACVIRAEFEQHISIGNSLITMYIRCGNIEDARTGFDRMPKRDIISWTAMLSGFVQQGHYEEALQLFYQMRQAGMEPELLIFVSALRACGSLAALEHGRQIHDLLLKLALSLMLLWEVVLLTCMPNVGTLMMHASCLIICQAEMLSPGLR